MNDDNTKVDQIRKLARKYNIKWLVVYSILIVLCIVYFVYMNNLIMNRDIVPAHMWLTTVIPVFLITVIVGYPIIWFLRWREFMKPVKNSEQKQNMSQIGFDSERTKQLKKSRAMFDLLWNAFFAIVIIVNIILLSNGAAAAQGGKEQMVATLVLIISAIFLPICVTVYFVKRTGYSRQINLAVQIDAEDFAKERAKIQESNNI